MRELVRREVIKAQDIAAVETWSGKPDVLSAVIRQAEWCLANLPAGASAADLQKFGHAFRFYTRGVTDHHKAVRVVPHRDPDLGPMFVHFSAVEIPEEHDRWLVQGFWFRGGVGVVGGPPKLGKTFAVVDAAVSVASGTALFGRYQVATPGPVLICAVEGHKWLVPDRIRNLCVHRKLDPGALPVEILDRPRLRLDDSADLTALRSEILRRKPVLLILDPLVRLHEGDENAAGPISHLLSDLQALQRETGVAIMLVHHTRKNSSRSARPGSSLRGSGDIWAWGDSNWYLFEAKSGGIHISVEQRGATSDERVHLRLSGSEADTHLEVVTDEVDGKEECPAAEQQGAADELRRRFISIVRGEKDGIGFHAVRTKLRIGTTKATRLRDALHEAGVITIVKRRMFIADDKGGRA